MERQCFTVTFEVICARRVPCFGNFESSNMFSVCDFPLFITRASAAVLRLGPRCEMLRSEVEILFALVLSRQDGRGGRQIHSQLLGYGIHISCQHDLKVCVQEAAQDALSADSIPGFYVSGARAYHS